MASPPLEREIDGNKGRFVPPLSLPSVPFRSVVGPLISLIACIDLDLSGSWEWYYKNHERRAPSVAAPMHDTTCIRAIPWPNDAWRSTALGSRGSRTNNVRGLHTLRTGPTFVYTYSYVSNRSNKVLPSCYLARAVLQF